MNPTRALEPLRAPAWHRRALGGAALAGALLLATSPAWRVWWLGTEPTLDELLALRCSAASKAPIQDESSLRALLMSQRVLPAPRASSSGATESPSQTRRAP